MVWLRTDKGRTGAEPDWYRNLLRHPECLLIVGGQRAQGRMQASSARESDLRRLVELWRAKYGAMWVQDWYVDQGRIPVKVELLET